MRRPWPASALAALAALALLAAVLYAASLRREPARVPGFARATPGPVRAGGARFSGSAPVRIALDSRPLGISPDGLARWLVRVRFLDAGGRETSLLEGGDVGFAAPAGTVRWQTRLRFGGAAAIVSTPVAVPLSLWVRPNVGLPLAPRRARTNPRFWRTPRIVAAALGPHLVQVGWFPRLAAGTVTLRRAEGGGRWRLLGLAGAPSSTFRDGSVRPGRSYRYRVARPGVAPVTLAVRVPPAPPHGTPASLAGKAMWLSFSPSLRDADSYATLDPRAIVDRARAAGLHALEVRTAYGPFWEVTPAAAPAVDALLDEAAARGVVAIGWTIPRAPEFDDLAAAVATASYRTARGHGFAALAVDLERGDEYLGAGPAGFAALTDYLRLLRAALGPGYPLIATVEDPYLEHLSDRTYPYAAIAASADVLQPMAYWRMLSKRAVTPAAVRSALRGSYAALRYEARRDVPIDLGGQTAAGGPAGAPPPDEIVASVREARALGALGITYFDWRGTSDRQWEALARSRW